MKTFTIGKKFNKQIGLRYADSLLFDFFKNSSQNCFIIKSVHDEML